jgi:hypothetical protein
MRQMVATDGDTEKDLKADGWRITKTVGKSRRYEKLSSDTGSAMIVDESSFDHRQATFPFEVSVGIPSHLLGCQRRVGDRLLRFNSSDRCFGSGMMSYSVSLTVTRCTQQAVGDSGVGADLGPRRRCRATRTRAETRNADA